jgi:hypothetical protein
MRPIVWKNPNKQEVHSGHLAWDRAVKCLAPGNVIDDGYFGQYIRPANAPWPAGGAAPRGAMRDFDFGTFRSFPLPPEVRAYTESVTETEYAILYGLFHHAGGHLIVHGWIVTRGTVPGSVARDDPRNYRLLRLFYTGRGEKSRAVVDTAVEYLTNR